jgi:hypothetical protein
MSRALSARFLARTLLRQASRGWDAEGQIMATIGDYAALRMLVAEPDSEGAGANVAAEVHEICGRVVVAVACEQRFYERFVPAVTIRLPGSRDPPLDKGALGQQQTPHPDLQPE